MLIKKQAEIQSSEITDKKLYLDRRAFLASAAAAGLAVAGFGAKELIRPSLKAQADSKLQFKPSNFSTTEKQTPLNDVTHYNNYYEFGTDKEEPANEAKNFKTRPWTVKVEGACKKPQTFDIDTLLKIPLEERVYRMRCVEGWSMVIPWIGFSISALLNQVEPHAQGEVRGVHVALRSEADAGAAARRAGLAVRGRVAHG